MTWLEGTAYFWVVLCKNRGVHNKYNLFSKHAIPLAEADEISSPPQVKTFTVRCDDCGEEYAYEVTDVLRAELYDVGAFTPHPLFEQSIPRNETSQQAGSACSSAKTTLLERVRRAVLPYLPSRRKETPPPYWRAKSVAKREPCQLHDQAPTPEEDVANGAGPPNPNPRT